MDWITPQIVVTALVGALIGLLMFIYKRDQKEIADREEKKEAERKAESEERKQDKAEIIKRVDYLGIELKAQDKALEHSLRNGYANARSEAKEKLIKDYEIFGEVR